MYQLLWILVIMYLLIQSSCSSCLEPFYTSNTIKQHKAFSIFHDEMFKHTTYHENDTILNGTSYYYNDQDKIHHNINSLTGWDKCKMTCPGNCLEFGVTGSAWCFDPKDKLLSAKERLELAEKAKENT